MAEIDFASLRARLAEPAAPTADPDEILEARARQLAGRDDTRRERRLVDRVVAVRRGESRYGFSASATVTVARVRTTRLPGAGGAVQGLFQIRGRGHSLIDLETPGGAAEPLPHGATALVVLLRFRGRTLGVRIDEVLAVRDIVQDDLDDEVTADPSAIVGAVTRDLLQLVDVERLFASPLVRRSGRKEDP